MKREVIVIVAPSDEKELKKVHECTVLDEMEEGDFSLIKEFAQGMFENIVDSYSCLRKSDLQCMIYRQKDESPLKPSEVEKILNNYEIDILKYDGFNSNFYAWN